MTYFVTFYSYKGGVGRTLALANVSWLLANHPTEPARVLVIDFDLGAPGLLHVFRIAKPKNMCGIVDYISSYLEDAAIPDVKDFIHRTVFKNVDIIPAGKMDRLYQRRFEAIDWKELYEGAFGFQLMERLKEDISKIVPEYDYVLIDSLTGYSDVGGICVKQLSDALVLLFRLNRQNLDGIGSVYKSFTGSTTESRGKPIFPVITPSWPFIDDAAEEWIMRAQALFGSEKLLEISFDSSLSFGERIISESASKLPLTSKIIGDYRALAYSIRKSNRADALTISQAIDSESYSFFDKSAELLLGLLHRRPDKLRYWRMLPVPFRPSHRAGEGRDPLPTALEALVSFARHEASKGNKYALYALSLLSHLPAVANENHAKQWLDRAIQIDHTFVEARIQRGNLAFSQRRYMDAIHDFEECLKLPVASEDGVSYDTLRALIAEALLRMFDAEGALREIESAIRLAPSEASHYIVRAKARFLGGDYSGALADAQLYASEYPRSGPNSLLPALVLAAMGRPDEASRVLRQAADTTTSTSHWDLAEAYLAIDPGETLRMLGPKHERSRPAIYRLLTGLARLFLGEDPARLVAEFEKPKERLHVDPTWSVFEVVAITRSKERMHSLSSAAIDCAYTLIRGSSDTGVMQGLVPISS